MIDDLKIIRDNYGPSFMFMCKELFSDILKDRGCLSKILLNYFNPNKLLYSDLIRYNKVEDFKKYIINLYEEYKVLSTIPTPEAIFNELGYNFYECTSVNEIDYLKGYFHERDGTVLFYNSDEYLKRNRLFVAVKKNINDIKRDKNNRLNKMDKYSTSLIFISFAKNNYNTLQIIGRYGDKYSGYKNLYRNDLECIKEGLTKSFKYHLDLGDTNNKEFNMPNYMCAKNGKYYKYNYEINGIYYCPDNMVIDTFDIKKINPDKFILFDYFLLDLEDKCLYLYDTSIVDGFTDICVGIKEIKYSGNTVKIILASGEYINILLDIQNNIIGLDSNTTKYINDNFLRYNTKIKELNLNNTRKIGKKFLYNNESLRSINLNKVVVIDDLFLHNNKDLQELVLEDVKIIGNRALYYNNVLSKISLPKIEYIGKGAFRTLKGVSGIPENDKVNQYKSTQTLADSVPVKKLSLEKKNTL